MLQHDRQLRLIAKNIEKRSKANSKLIDTDRGSAIEFFKVFGLPIKYGIYSGFGAERISSRTC